MDKNFEATSDGVGAAFLVAAVVAVSAAAVVVVVILNVFGHRLFWAIVAIVVNILSYLLSLSWSWLGMKLSSSMLLKLLSS